MTAPFKRPPFTLEPPMAVAMVCELLGRCPRCSAPVVRTPDGWALVTHVAGCRLADDVMRGAS